MASEMLGIQTKRVVMLAIMAAFAMLAVNGQKLPKIDPGTAESRAISFLTREVPAWSKGNGCFSCHNNGDAARALYTATLKGISIPANALADTTAWISEPNGWDQNKGDPGFSDKRLANVQFAASLLAAIESGFIKDRRPLEQAARKLAADQEADGAWHIDAGTTLGSPATYGTPLATFMALRTLKAANLPESKPAIRKAEEWLSRTSTTNVMTAASLLLASANSFGEPEKPRQSEYLKLILDAQTGDGGWGPYADSPPEVFDTALVLIALAELKGKPDIDEAILRGRIFLAGEQNTDGSWPETTRPSGGESYAQRLSTTGWATLALLATR